MSYKTNYKQQVLSGVEFKELAMAHGSLIIEVMRQMKKTNIDMNDPNASRKFGKVMKVSFESVKSYNKGA